MIPPSHTLEIQSWQPLHAVCSCGLWSMCCAVKGFLTEEEARLEAQEAHDAHLADLVRRERLSRIIYPKGKPNG